MKKYILNLYLNSLFRGGGGVSSCGDLTDTFVTYHVGAALAFSYNRYDTMNQARKKIDKLFELKYIEKGDTIMFSAGEPDIRVHVFVETKKQNKSVEEIIDGILDNYFEFLTSLTKDYNVWVWGPIASQRNGLPTNPDYIYNGTEEERNKATLIYNEKLKERAEKAGIKFFSIAKEMIDENLHTKNFFLTDEIHLSQRAWKYAIPEFKKAGVDVSFKEEWWKQNVSVELPNTESFLLQSANMTRSEFYKNQLKSIREHLVVSDINATLTNIGNVVFPVDALKSGAAYSFSQDKDMDFEEILSKYNIPTFFWKEEQILQSNPNLKQLNANLVANATAKKAANDFTLFEIVAQTGFIRNDNLILRLNLNTLEYSVLSEMSYEFLQKFKFISVKLNRMLDPGAMETGFFALDKLNATHALVYVRAMSNVFVLKNNGKVLPNELEATYVLRKAYNVSKSERFFPTELDSNLNVVNLGYWG